MGVPVAVIGARGRLGRSACDLLRRDERFDLVAEFGREHRLEAALPECGARVVLDATAAGLGARHGLMALCAGLRPVIATSGVTRAELVQLDQEARTRGLGGLVVPNLSLGMAWLNRCAQLLARESALIPQAIIERHHERKRDAPSATACDTVARLKAAGAVGPIPIHSVRAPGHYAHQEVLFASAGETLTLRHDMLGPEAFAPGLVAALLYAGAAQGVDWGLEVALSTALDPVAANPSRTQTDGASGGRNPVA